MTRSQRICYYENTKVVFSFLIGVVDQICIFRMYVHSLSNQYLFKRLTKRFMLTCQVLQLANRNSGCGSEGVPHFLSTGLFYITRHYVVLQFTPGICNFAKMCFLRLLEIVFFLYFASHIPITALFDTQAVQSDLGIPKEWYPEEVISATRLKFQFVLDSDCNKNIYNND